MRADRRDPAIAALRKHKPVKFTATLRDGTTKAIALSTKANKWELLSDTLGAIPWTSIEALDNDGAVLGAIENDEEYEDDVSGDGELERLARIMLNVMTTTQVETRKMFADSMKVHAEMAQSMLESNRVMHESYSIAMKVQAASLTSGSPEEQDKVMQMMGMAMALMNKGTPTIQLGVTPPNGKKT